MASGVVYDGVARQGDGDDTGDGDAEAGDNNGQKLFSGLKLWFSRSVPTRTWLMQNAEANGATIVVLEKQADVLLVDHARNHQPPGSYSYQFVELSIRNGVLEDLDKHRIGQPARVDRPVGSVVTAPKGTRTPFTEQDDQFLWDYVTPLREKGGLWKGNEIYKQVEAINSRHTFQSWRDRYIKHVQYHNRTVTVTAGSSTQPSEAVTQPLRAEAPPPPSQKRRLPIVEVPSKRQRMATPEYEVERPRVEERLPLSPLRVRSVLPEDSRASSSRTRADLEAQPERSSLQHLVPVAARKAVQNMPIENDQVRLRPDGSNSPVEASLTRPATPERSSSRESSILATPESQVTGDIAFEANPSVETPADLPGNFERKHFRQLFRATINIVRADPTDLATAFEAVAGDRAEVGHSGREWRKFWQTSVLPVWCERHRYVLSDFDNLLLPSYQSSRRGRNGSVEVEMDSGDVACAQCFTKESNRWRHDRQGRTLCNDCGTLLKEARLRSLSGRMANIAEESQDDLDAVPAEVQVHGDAEAEEDDDVIAELEGRPTTPGPTSAQIQRTPRYSDAAVQTSPVIAADETPRRVAIYEVEETQVVPGPPAPNESRKRSAGRASQSTSQETNPSKDGVDADTLKHVSQDDADLRMNNTNITPARAATGKQRTLEIPPTPEHTGPAVSNGSFNRASTESGRGLRDESPLFVPQEDEEQPSSPPLIAGGRGSSPLRVQLIDDHDQIGVHDDAEDDSQQDDDDDLPTSESGYNFETTPELSEEWETAPEQAHPSTRRASIEAPLGQAADGLEESDFDLIAPEGGWEGLDIPEPTEDDINAVEVVEVVKSMEVVEDDIGVHRRDDDGEHSVEQNSAELVELSSDSDDSPDYDDWLAEQKQVHQGVKGIDQMLSTAIEATSFDYELAASVTVRMVQYSLSDWGRRLRREGRVPPPNDVAGCWTVEDDDQLRSGDRWDLEFVELKHGLENCNARREFLEELSKA